MSFAIPAPDGQAYRLLQRQDWSTSSLGKPETWPDTLKVALGLILRSPESMYVLWGPERLFFFNDAYLPLLGEARLHRSAGRPMAEVWADIWDAIEDAIERTYAGESFRYEDQLLRMAREGIPEETYWSYSFSPLCEPDGAVSGLFCVTREQTKRIGTERRQTSHNTALIAEVEKGREDLASTQEQLRQSQKLEAIGQLTGGVAHDFNNLLTVIKGSIELLQRPSLTDQRRKLYIEAISDASDRAAKLTGQLLAFARRQALNPEIFDAGKGLTDIAGMIRPLIGSRIELDITTPGEPVSVLADKGQLDTAVINMAVNARDAMQGAGRLTIAIGPASRIPPVRSHKAVPGDFVALAITDTGSGIEPDKISQIFEPFFTTKAVGEGTGLGLSQVFGFAKQSGGEIQVESEVGKGTTFTMYLPRAYPKVLREDTAEISQTIDGEGLCVLLVEDNPTVGRFASAALNELGYASVLAPDAQRALALLEEDRSRFHIVFSDVMMPGIDGMEMGERIRTLYPGLPVILTSGYSHVLSQTDDHGFELLHKPYSIEQLSRVLQKAVS